MISVGVLSIGFSHKTSKGALLWATLTGCCVAGYTVIDAQGVRAAPTAASYIVWTFLMLGGGIASFFAISRGRRFVAVAASQWKPGVIAGTLSIVTYGLALYAFRLGATPRLAALRETSILFATGIAVLILKERIGRSRSFGVGTIFLGAVVLIGKS